MARGKSRRPGYDTGFTLIELLVVVLVIGILAAIAIPQYFKVVERGRLSEAQNFVSVVKQAQERYLARNGIYDDGTDNLVNLDIDMAAAPCYGMKNFQAGVTGIVDCTGAGIPGYTVTVSRQNGGNNCGFSAAKVAARYNGYQVVYNSCAGAIAFANCGSAAYCDQDFAQ